MLVDSDVLIECLRGSRAANSWLTSLDQNTIQIPGIVAMELIAGCRNAAEMRQTQKLLNSLDLVWTDSWDSRRAHSLLVGLRLSHGIGISDCLIAAMALERRCRLYSFNLKHFQIVPNLDVQQPFLRHQ